MQLLSLKEKQLSDKKDSNAQYILQKEMELSMKQNFLTQEANRWIDSTRPNLEFYFGNWIGFTCIHAFLNFYFCVNFFRLKRERDTCRKFEIDLKKLQRDLVKMQREISQGGSNQCGQSSNVRNIHVQTDPEEESRAIMDECRTLRREKVELTNLVQEKRSKIEQITQHSAQLSRQLEEAHLLRSAHVEVPARIVPGTNTIVSESSSTEDILQDAKMRLKRLEEESSKADQYFCSFVSTTS